MFNKSMVIDKNIAAAEQGSRLFLLILTTMSVVGLLASDIYLPNLPSIASAFGRDIQDMQLTLGVYLFGLSIGQLFYGPLTERYGRKKVLLSGMTIFLFASLSCAMSFSYEQLLVSRLIQSLGACSGLIIGRAIVGDLFDAKKSGEIFATIFPFVGMSPAIAPVIGGLVGYYSSWHMNFIIVALIALFVIATVWLYLPETLQRVESPGSNNSVSMYFSVLKDKRFFQYALAPCVAYIAYFSYIAQSPFIFHAYGFGQLAIGTFYVTLSMTYIAGNLTGKKLLKQRSIDQLLTKGYLTLCAGSVLLVLSGGLSLAVSYDGCVNFDDHLREWVF